MTDAIERLEKWISTGKVTEEEVVQEWFVLRELLRAALGCIKDSGDYCHTRCTPETPCGYHAFITAIESELGRTE